MDAKQTVGYIRARGGLSRADLARLANVAPSTVGRIESGDLEPTWAVMNRILEAAGYNPLGELTPSGDNSVVRAARVALGEIPAANAGPVELSWLERWRRARLLNDEFQARQIDKLGAQAGIAAPIYSRPTERVSVVYDQSWQAVTAKLRAANIGYAVSGITATSPTRATDGAAWPLLYVDGLSNAIAAANLTIAPPGSGAVITLMQFDDTSSTGTVTEDDETWVSAGQALIDSYAGPGRMADQAESVAAIWQTRVPA